MTRFIDDARTHQNSDRQLIRSEWRDPPRFRIIRAMPWASRQTSPRSGCGLEAVKIRSEPGHSV